MRQSQSTRTTARRCTRRSAWGPSSQRARTLAARYEVARCSTPEVRPVSTPFESQAVAFPNAEHDDRVDAMVDAADLNTIRPVLLRCRPPQPG